MWSLNIGQYRAIGLNYWGILSEISPESNTPGLRLLVISTFQFYRSEQQQRKWSDVPPSGWKSHPATGRAPSHLPSPHHRVCSSPKAVWPETIINNKRLLLRFDNVYFSGPPRQDGISEWDIFCLLFGRLWRAGRDWLVIWRWGHWGADIVEAVSVSSRNDLFKIDWCSLEQRTRG